MNIFELAGIYDDTLHDMANKLNIQADIKFWPETNAAGKKQGFCRKMNVKIITAFGDFEYSNENKGAVLKAAEKFLQEVASDR